ncbi:MAG: secretin and TonB N-terminal domain-containing protein [Candidatus Omnitrophica bacterium]|nr:secretin and TonB N-terminal domain-containing protein [Candidatus Omnitrophota bacterium]
MKKNTNLFFILVFIFFSLQLYSLQQTFGENNAVDLNEKATTPATLNKEDEKISLSLRNIDIVDALKFFSMKLGFNIIPTQKVSGRITLNVENAPVKDVFDILLRSNNLAYDKKGDIYNVMTEAEYRQLYGKNFFDTRQVKVFHLKYAIPEQAFTLLDAVKSEIGRILVDSESGAVIIIDTPEKIEQAQKTLEALEQKSSIKVFNLQYAKAKDVEEQLKNQLDLKRAGTVKADDRTNQIIVQTLPERMKNVEELIKNLDKKTKAVLIDTKIIKIKLSDQQNEGIQWEGLFQIAKQFGMAYIGSYPFSPMTAGMVNPSFRTRQDVYNTAGQVGYYPFSGTTSSLNLSTKVTPGEKMHIGIVDGKRDFDTLINYLKTLGKSKIMASPSIAVVNNQEARIHIGEKRAYITTTTTTGATTKTVSEEVTYINVGVTLSVIPTINDDGYITMRVKPEISNVIGNLKTSSDNIIPILDTNTAETTVLAKNGSTVIIGGLGREEVATDEEGIPYLSKIPILGFLFRSGTRKVERVELIIMLTPIIFEGDKFINPKEIEKLEIKPFKKFDVFRPEGPLKGHTYYPIKVKLYPKDEKLQNLALAEDQKSDVFMKKDLPIKSFKPYNKMEKSLSEQKEISVKGFKSYE